MIYTELTKKAMQIAFDAHKEQVDKAGLPYIYHPIHLAEQMDTEEEVCAALLHDVIEDTGITPDNLRAYGFPESVMTALSLLTHNDEEEYMDYIEKIKTNPLAKKVKLADLRHNRNKTRYKNLDNRSLGREIKYVKAMSSLHNIPERETDAEPLKRNKVPLDNERLWFLSIYKNKDDAVVKYTFDVEKAGDSHYELVAEEYSRLAKLFGGKDTIEALKEYIGNHSEHEFTALLDRLEIFYKPFHYD